MTKNNDKNTTESCAKNRGKNRGKNEGKISRELFNITYVKKLIAYKLPEHANGRRVRVGEDHHKAKLTNKEVEEIRDLREFGIDPRTGKPWKIKDIAVKYGVHKSVVSRICSYHARAITPDEYVLGYVKRKSRIDSSSDGYDEVTITRENESVPEPLDLEE